MTMLIRYKFKNFRSFLNDAEISMTATSQTTLSDNLIRLKQKRFLPSAVIYGANASGKSNIMLSLKILQTIIITGSISSSNDELKNLELYPFIHSSKDEPMVFETEFFNDNLHCFYILEINVNKCRPNGKRYISKEELYLKSNNKSTLIYSRNENSINISTELSALRYMNSSSKFIQEIQQKLTNNMDETALFLTGGFKNTISSKLAECIISFFRDKLIIINDFTKSSSNFYLKSRQTIKDDFMMWNNILDGFAKGADFGPQQMIFKSDTDHTDEHTAEMKLYSVYQNEEKNVFIPAQIMESTGTLKMIDFALLFAHSFSQGCTLIMDEFDSSLHSEIVKGILALFNSPKINKNFSQLIFTTHNPIYLNNKIFRRDQIIFVDKDKENFQSEVYTLADFGSTEVRNDENYLINYFKGKYTSMPYIDFFSLIVPEEKYNEGE